MAEPTVRERVEGNWRLTVLQQLAYDAMRVLGRVQLTGIGQLPVRGPMLLAMNHQSMLDGPLLCGLVPRPVSCLVKAEAFGPAVGWLLRQAGQLAIVRDVVDPAPVRLCLEVLWAGGVVGIYPEGTRGDGAVRQVKPGVGYLALRSGASVVPVACHGSGRLGRTWRPSVRVVVGTPLVFERHPRRRPLNRNTTAEATELVRSRLAELVASTAPGPAGAAGTLAG